MGPEEEQDEAAPIAAKEEARLQTRAKLVNSAPKLAKAGMSVRAAEGSGEFFQRP